MRLAFSQMRLAKFEMQAALGVNASRILKKARRIFRVSLENRLYIISIR